ncbi:MAG: hypothetical protein HYU64_15895 [Armatimonadetes bacterium]|nr:hypothetical protein [Armatimonadota bacterium]
MNTISAGAMYSRAIAGQNQANPPVPEPPAQEPPRPEPPPPPPPPPPVFSEKQWTYGVYLGADNNLVTYMTNNVEDMEKVGSNAKMNVLAQLDRGPNGPSSFGGWSGARRFYVERDSDATLINSPVVENMGLHTDMSSPKTLTDFVVWMEQKYPAKNVALILNDHGGGWKQDKLGKGAISDDHDGDFMSMPTIRQALEEAQAATGKKLAFLAYDACLMGQLEVAYETRNLTDFMGGSEKTEGAYGWHYEELLQKYYDKPNLTAKDMGDILVETNSKHPGDIQTFSIVDSAKVGDLATATDGLARAIIASQGSAKAVKDDISGAVGFGYGYKDLGNIATKIANDSRITDEALKAAAGQVEAKVKEAVTAEWHKDSYNGATGVTIYAPSYGVDSDYRDLQFAKDTQWDEAMEFLKSA